MNFYISKADLNKIDQLIKRFSTVRVYAELDRFFDKIALWVAGQITKNKLSGNPVNRRTGNLARSVTGRAVREKGMLGFRVGIFRGPALRYAGVIEYGTKGYNSQSPYNTIRPKKAKALAMPVNDALTPAGVSRYQGPRDYAKARGELTFIPFKRGSGAIGALYTEKELLAGETDFSNAKAAYILLKKADIRPRWYLKYGVMNALPGVVTRLSKFLGKLLRGEKTK
jgi:hypothetical protein